MGYRPRATATRAGEDLVAQPYAPSLVARARRHLISLRSFIAADNPRAAFAVAARIREAVEALLDQPGTGRPGRVPGTRELVIAGTPYIVAYTVLGGQQIEILAVFHGKQKWPDSL